MKELLEKWYNHIKRRYEMHCIQASNYEIPLEVIHTCHGCGGGGTPLWDGLCQTCNKQYKELINETE